MIASILSNPGFYMTYALVQAIVVLLLIRFLDLYEREPLSVLALMAVWGATGAAALALIGNEALDSLLSGDVLVVFGNAVSPPLVEEAAKGLALVFAVLASHWVGSRTGVLRFAGLTDGIVYGAAVGLGFAFTEDFFYFLDRARSGGLEAGFDLFLGRRDFFGPAVLHHALFTAAFGAGLGLATWARRPAARLGFAVTGFAVAVLMHAVNNGLVELILTGRYGLATTAAWARGEPVSASVDATADDARIGLALLDYAYLAAFLTAVAIWLRYQRRVIRSELLEEAETGLVRREDWELVFRSRDRSLRYWQLLRSGQLDQWRLLRRLHRALVELALLKWSLRRYGGDWSSVNRARRMIATLASFDERPSNLPADLGRLIGRAHEREEVVGMLRRADVRLLTLTGPGGVGKTRLALHVAEQLRDSFASGVFFVPRVSEPDPALLMPQVARTLGAGELAENSLDRLLEFLRDKQLLVVIDSFEQVIGAGPSLAELLSGAPRVKVLATSRQALRVSEEHEYTVPPLSYPAAGASATPVSLRGYGSVELFLDRAQAVAPSFELTAENAPAIAEICRHLEGLPLAIDLAAARVRVLRPKALLERLTDPLALLAGGARDLTVRHQTLRATIDWSYRLLEPGEQRLFARLAVFAGGWRLDAAEAVCAETDDQDGLVLDGLSSLVEKSLVRQASISGLEPRFLMAAAVREYALERLSENGELAAVRATHAEYYVSFAEQAEPELMGSEQVLWASRLDEESENFRAALAWALVPDRVERLSGILVRAERGTLRAADGDLSLRRGLRLARALARIWEQQGRLVEGRRWLETALESGGDLGADVRGRALLQAGRLAGLQSDYERAVELLEEGLALLRTQRERDGIAFAFSDLAWIAFIRGEWQRGDELVAQGLAVADELGERRSTATLLTTLGRGLAERGETARARPLIERALALRKDEQDRRELAASLIALGRLELLDRHLEQATVGLDRALSFSRDLGAKLRLSDALHQRAVVSLELGETGRSLELLQERLVLCRELGDRLGLAEVLSCVAELAHEDGDSVRAVVLLGAADALRGSIGAQPWPFEDGRTQRVLAAARQTQEPSAFDTAWAVGASMSLEDASRRAADPAYHPERRFSQPLVLAG